MSLFNSITLPCDLEGDYFEEFVKLVEKEIEEQIQEHRQSENKNEKFIPTILLFCDGYGGHWLTTFSIIGLIKELQVGNIAKFNTMINSSCVSGHSLIWASGEIRSASEYAELKIHDAAVLVQEALPFKELQRLLNESKKRLSIMADVYSKACSNKKYRNHSYWFEEILEVGSSYINLDLQQLKQRGMLS